MAQRTCEIEGCVKKHLARGMCGPHYNEQYRAARKEAGGSHHTYVDRICETCGTTWKTPRPEARFCTAKCKGVYLSERNRKSCPIPDGHPVRQLMKVAAAAEREARKAKAAAKARPFAWRTARECPGCGCWFTPLRTPNTICCSQRCVRRVHRWRRNAAERGARGTFTWSEFMRIARKFNYCCAYCGTRPDALDPDHVVALSRGGSNSTTNLLPSCRPCNGDKRDLLLHEWEDDRERRNLPPRLTVIPADDPRFTHLTEALLVARAA